MTIAFSNSRKKIPKQGIFGPKFGSFFGKMWQLHKFEGADNKYDNSF